MEEKSLYAIKDISISREQSAAMKGLLISLIVLGHCKFFVNVFPSACWDWLYCFHVTGFFILPWFYGNTSFSSTNVKKYARRLLWPYTYMFIFLFLLCSIQNNNLNFDFGLFDTFFTGNFYLMRKYTGLQYLWFLPAMFSMMVLKDVFNSISKKWKFILYFIGAVFFMISWVFLWRSPYSSFNHELAEFSILSFMIGFAMLFLGVSTKKIMEKWTLPNTILIAIMISSLIVMIFTSDSHNSNYWCPINSNIVRWISRIICPIAGFLCLFRVGNLLIFRQIGELSLPIYLLQPVNQIVCSFFYHFCIHPIFQFLLSFMIVLSLSYMISKVIVLNKGLHKILLPR